MGLSVRCRLCGLRRCCWAVAMWVGWCIVVIRIGGVRLGTSWRTWTIRRTSRVGIRWVCVGLFRVWFRIRVLSIGLMKLGLGIRLLRRGLVVRMAWSLLARVWWSKSEAQGLQVNSLHHFDDHAPVVFVATCLPVDPLGCGLGTCQYARLSGRLLGVAARGRVCAICGTSATSCRR